MGSKKFAVYTAIIGGYDQFVQIPQGDFDYFLFSDQPMGAGWGKFKLIERQFEDPTRDARRIKILSHEFLPDYEYTLWLDGSMRSREIHPEKLVQDMFQESFIRVKGEGREETDLVTFKHPHRDCIYEEAAICWHFERDKREVIRGQVERYRELGFPPGKGLAETGVILRRQTKKIVQFNDAWWTELKHGSRRDQISFPFAAWLTRLKYRLLSGTWGDYGFAKELHLTLPRQ